MTPGMTPREATRVASSPDLPIGGVEDGSHALAATGPNDPRGRAQVPGGLDQAD